MAEDTRASADDLRRALLDQLAYLIDEVEALKAVVDRVPEPLQAARPLEEDLSLKEIYGMLVTLDEAVHLPRLRRMVAEDEPAFDAVEAASLVRAAGWNEQPILAILDRVQQTRRDLLSFISVLPAGAWTSTAYIGAVRSDVYGLAHAITQQDVDLLRMIGYRLHESHLTRRAEDLPK